MLKRKVTNKLLEWKNNINKKCLLIDGARQVGKTYIIEDFCKKNYDNYIYINFYRNNEATEIFDGDLSIDTIFSKLSYLYPNVKLIPNKTIIFLDEIGECPNAITALKFLVLESKCDIIASGSLLGINYKDIKSYPVGYVEHLEMHSLDFEEFCWANGINEDAIEHLKGYLKRMEQVPTSIHNRMIELFKTYIVIGGMPAAVNEYITTKNFANVLKIQRDIIKDYKMDISKYAKDNERAKIHECFESIPAQLSKDYKKFQYKTIKKGGRSSEYEACLEWLKDAGFISLCYNLRNPEEPFAGNKVNDCFKVYMRDTGLLISMLDDGTNKNIMQGNLGIYKGAIYENIIADIFTKLEKKLYYFEYNSTLEIDFFIKYNEKVTAVEVKSADNTQSKSLKSILENWKVEQGIRLSIKNIGTNNNKIISLPIYMSIFLVDESEYY